MRIMRPIPFLRPFQSRPINRFTSPSLQSLLTQSQRYQSTAASTVTPNPASSKINGPSTTLPASLDLPARAPGQSFFPGYAFKLGKAYATFYKTGVKNIYHNFVASRPIQQRIDTAHEGSLDNAVKAGALTRSEFQLLTRNWHDVKRVPIFALVFLICGEFTPLVVVALTSVVPWTCRIPKQLTSERTKLESRRNTSFRNLTAKYVKGQPLDRMQLLHISWSLGLSSSMWDWVGGRLPGLPTAVLRSKVARRVKYLEMDDSLIKKSGVVAEMSLDELKMALVERGMDVLNRGESQLRGDMNAWLRSQKEGPERLLLTR